MSHLDKLRARLKEQAAAVNTIAADVKALTDKPEGEFNADDLTKMKDLTAKSETARADMAATESEIKAFEAAELAKAAVAVPAAQRVDTVPAQAKSQVFTGQEKIGLAAVHLIKAYKEDAGRGSRAVLKSLDDAGFGEIANEFAIGQKTMTSLSGSTGGFAVPPDFNPDIYGMLTPYTAFLRGNPTMQPMPNGNFRQSAMASRPVVGYRVEAAAASVSTATLRDIDMSAKILSGLVPISNELIAYTAQRAARAAIQVLGQAVGIKIDEAMLLGNGTSPNPRGILNIVGVGSVAAAAGTTPTAVQVDAAVRPPLNVIESFPELQFGLAWVGTQRVLGYLSDLRTPGGENYAYPTLQGPNPTFKNYPFLKTAQVPNNGGAGTNESTLSLVCFGQVLYGESAGMTLSISDEASYVDAGNTVSSYQNNLSLLRVNLSHDVELKYLEAVQKLTAVQWGA